MAANQQDHRKKRPSYVLLLVFACIAAAAGIGFVHWQKHEQKRAAQNEAQRKLELLKQYLSQDAPKARMSDKHPCVYVSIEPKAEGPSVGECGMSASLFSDPVDRFEMDLRYGSFVLRQTDLLVSDNVAIPLTRVYTSLDWAEPNHVQSFGNHANHTYNIAPLGAENPTTWLALALEDGDFLFFDRVSKGMGYSDAVFRQTETDGKFYKAITYWNDKGWKTKLADGSSISFPDPSQGGAPLEGAPVEIQDAKGNRLQLMRDSGHKLQEIHTAQGHSIHLIYNDRGWISRAWDDQAHWVMYLYNSNGMLASVIDSSGKKRLYDYAGTELTAITDEEDRVLLHNTYENGHIASQEFHDGTTYEYSYHWAQNGQYAESAILRLPDGAWQGVETAPFVPNHIKQNKEWTQASRGAGGGGE